MSSVITISQPPVVPGDKTNLEPSERITFAPAPDSDEDIDDFEDSFEDAPAESPNSNPSPSTSRNSQSEGFNIEMVDARNDQSESGSGQTMKGGNDDVEKAKAKARVGSLEKLQGGSSKGGKEKDTGQDTAAETARKEREEEKEEEKDKLTLHPVRIKSRRRSSRVPEAIIVLKEERASLSSQLRLYQSH
jgi:hypothetical protein